MRAIDRRGFAMGLGALAGAALFGRSAVAASAKAGSQDLLSHVHPELRPAAERLVQISGPTTGKVDISALIGGRRMMAPRPPLAAPEVKKVMVSGRAGAPDIAVYVVNPRPGGARPVIVHLHGGGFVLGSAAGDLAALQPEALALDCVIVTVDYRLAPEAPFPAPLEDAYAGLLWTYRNCASFGGDPQRIAVQGESAGGGLAAMLALMARDRGEVPLVHQSLIYPMLDDRTGAKPLPFPIGSLAWTAPLNQAAWSAFLGQAAGGVRAPAGAVPARAPRLDGLPGAFIGVGSIDLFVGEDIEYARRLIDAAVPTELLVVPGAFHGFDMMARDTGVARRFRLAQLTALAHAFKTPPPAEAPA